jgi:hypothetical protein
MHTIVTPQRSTESKKERKKEENTIMDDIEN